MAENSIFPIKNRLWVSVILVVGLTLVALFLGRLLKDSIENQTIAIERRGIKASIQKGWSVQNGVDGESTQFTVTDPFQMSHRYLVAQQPVVQGGLLTDSVVTRNLERAQALQNYAVIEQASVRVNGMDGYRVKFAYTEVPRFSKIPVTIMGVDYYLAGKETVWVITMEEQAHLFEDVYPLFIRFLNGLVVPVGGKP